MLPSLESRSNTSVGCEVVPFINPSCCVYDGDTIKYPQMQRKGDIRRGLGGVRRQRVRCGWCLGKIPEKRRRFMVDHNREAKFCSNPCGKRAAKKAHRDRQAASGSRAAARTLGSG